MQACHVPGRETRAFAARWLEAFPITDAFENCQPAWIFALPPRLHPTQQIPGNSELAAAWTTKRSWRAGERWSAPSRDGGEGNPCQHWIKNRINPSTAPIAEARWLARGRDNSRPAAGCVESVAGCLKQATEARRAGSRWSIPEFSLYLPCLSRNLGTRVAAISFPTAWLQYPLYCQKAGPLSDKVFGRCSNATRTLL